MKPPPIVLPAGHETRISADLVAVTKTQNRPVQTVSFAVQTGRVANRNGNVHQPEIGPYTQNPRFGHFGAVNR